MDQVTLSWSLKNFVTVNLMVLAFGAGMVAISQVIKASGKKAATND